MSDRGFRPEYTDQTDIFNPASFGHPVTVIGCGGIGASVLPTLATLGVPEIILFDDDLVEPRNVAATIMFGPDDIGQPKVEVAERKLHELGVRHVTTHQVKFDPEQHGDSLTGVVVSGVDSMAARKAIWPAISWNGLVPLYMDGRIGGQIFQLNALNPCDPAHVEWYEDFELFDDSEGADLPCAARNVVYPSVVLGGVMASKLAAFSRGETVKRQIVMDMGLLKIIHEF